MNDVVRTLARQLLDACGVDPGSAGEVTIRSDTDGSTTVAIRTVREARFPGWARVETKDQPVAPQG